MKLRSLSAPSVLRHRRWMSVRPAKEHDAFPRKEKVTIQTLQALRSRNEPITMLTAYDYPTALACSANSSIDITLVGDSLAQVCLGLKSTTQLTLDQMIHHASAVARGTTHPLLVADMPFGSYHSSVEAAINNAVRMIREAQVEAVKLEGGEEIAELVRRLVSLGIPCMAHIGLLPQRHVASSGYKVQGKSVESAKALVRTAKILEEAGAFSMVVEAVPKELGRFITEQVGIPTIGIGAGPWTNGQVLVWDDAMGTWHGKKAKFVRRFADLQNPRDAGVEDYARAVKGGLFPDPQRESYSMEQNEARMRAGREPDNAPSQPAPLASPVHLAIYPSPAIPPSASPQQHRSSISTCPSSSQADCMSLSGERCDACGSIINAPHTPPCAPHQIDSLALDTTPFSESFSGLIDIEGTENDEPIDASFLHALDDEDDIQLQKQEEISYYVEQYSDVNELDPDWDDDDVAEVMVLSPKQRTIALPTISEEYDARSIASDEAHCSAPKGVVTLADFEMIPTSEYPMLCRERSTNKLYAIKALNRGLHLEKNIMETIRELDMPFLERLQWTLPGSEDEKEGRIYLILDSSYSETIASVITERMLPVADVHFYACELVAALACLHDASIVHRDITPFNVFLDDTGHILLANFCNATILCDGRQTSSPESAAIEYQAPEVFLGWTHGAASDCWSFGLLLHYLLTGKNPLVIGSDPAGFSSQILSAEPDLSAVVCPQAKDLIEKCLEKNPALRPTIGAIRDHVYFSTVDWKNVRGKFLAPPIRNRSPSPKRPLSSDFPLPPTRFSQCLDGSLDLPFTVQTASKARTTVPRLERVEVRDTIGGIAVGPRRPSFRSSCSMDDLRSRSQVKRWSLNIPPSNSARIPHHRPSRSTHDTGTSSLLRSNSVSGSFPSRLSLQVQSPELLPAIFRPTPLDDRLVTEEASLTSASPAISSPTVCEPSPRQRMAQFWETLDAEEQQQQPPAAGASLELRDAMRLVLPYPPLPRGGRKVKKRASLGFLSSDRRNSVISGSPPPPGNKLRKLRRPLSTPLLHKRSSEVLNLPTGVEQIGKGIGFTYKIQAANHSKASICTSSAAGRLLRSSVGFGKNLLRKVKSTPKLKPSPSGVGARRARGSPARIQTGVARVVSAALPSPATSDGPLTPESAAFAPLPEMVGDPFAKDEPRTSSVGHGIRLVPVESKLGNSPTMSSLLMSGWNV
ncbi:AGC/AKT protein kinase [Mycena kentingensis (nom. inval.)]|nr:AGC/AKT protein kinase [Mycena kentingensis (nom. inval.)]